ncbi:hypothetical protein E2C01_067776 [Portunus trituberculatus]|uniref:Uncharacterized protein n=1 Tax=Portunus trituberculatus TaxID=210409 RepID=A0A5B7HW15_PORTR|nr:hypothetical protein [Portunus trituberculatus]
MCGCGWGVAEEAGQALPDQLSRLLCYAARQHRYLGVDVLKCERILGTVPEKPSRALPLIPSSNFTAPPPS